MPIAKTDQLFRLIKSLDKAEKRNFTLYVKRLHSNQDVKFLKLFSLLARMDVYDEKMITQKIAGLTQNKLSNLKRHLYSQILKSLRLIHNQKEVDLQIREQLDFAKILYTKGMYLQSLKILDRSKNIAKQSNQDTLLLEILEFEKMIESRHITRSRKVKNKVESLIDESSKVRRVIETRSDLANLNLKIHGLYIKIGHVKDDLDSFIVKDYFFSNLPTFSFSNLSFFEKVHLHQSYVWYYYIRMEFHYCYRHACKWVELFHKKPIMIEKDPDLYMRGLHYLLTSLFYLRHYRKYEHYYQIFQKFYNTNGDNFNTNSRLIYFIYGFNAKLNYYFLHGDYNASLKVVPEILENIQQLQLNLDMHRKIIYYYKIAWIYFALSKFELALDYLFEINNLKKEHLRSDILCYTKLAILITHFELGNYTLVENLIPSTNRFFESMKESNPVQKGILNIIKIGINKNGEIQKYKLTSLKDKLQRLSVDKYSRRVFMYFDFLNWVESKIQKKTIAEITQNQYKDSII